MDYTKKFDDHAQLITQERGEHYGHPLDNFNDINVMKWGLRNCPDSEIRHAMEMICVKMARLVRTPDHIDSIIDIAGYARTMAMILDERQTRLEKGDDLYRDTERTFIPGVFDKARSDKVVGVLWDEDV